MSSIVNEILAGFQGLWASTGLAHFIASPDPTLVQAVIDAKEAGNIWAQYGAMIQQILHQR